jgi:hypothetical protein
MPSRFFGLAAFGLVLALTIGAGGALAQSSSAPSSSGQAAAPPTTGSEQGVNPPNAHPGSTSVSAAPGRAQPDRVPTTNPASDGKATSVK